MAIQIRRAERKKAKLRLGIAAPSGAGKTYSSLLLAFGLGGKIGMIDTENGSGDLYATLGEYDIISIQEPYTVAKYIEAIKAFEDADYNVIVIDSLSHAWAGSGGLLDKQGKITDRGTNSFAAWRTVTPEYNSLVEAMLKSKCHVIATMRSKVEYVLETNDKGKQQPKKIGMAPVQREGLDFEFTVMLDIDANHIANASKDRTGLFDGRFFKIEKEVGRELLSWLETGKEVEIKTTNSTLLDSISASNTLDALKNNFVLAMKTANISQEDIIQFTEAKDLRKEQLSKSETKSAKQLIEEAANNSNKGI